MKFHSILQLTILSGVLFLFSVVLLYSFFINPIELISFLNLDWRFTMFIFLGSILSIFILILLWNYKYASYRKSIGKRKNSKSILVLSTTLLLIVGFTFFSRFDPSWMEFVAYFIIMSGMLISALLKFDEALFVHKFMYSLSIVIVASVLLSVFILFDNAAWGIYDFGGGVIDFLNFLLGAIPEALSRFFRLLVFGFVISSFVSYFISSKTTSDSELIDNEFFED